MKPPCYLVTLSLESSDFQTFLKQYVILVPSGRFDLIDGIDTALISTSVIMAGVGLIIPVMLPLEIAAIICGWVGACVKLVRCKLKPKAQKHYEINTLGESKLNSI